MKKMFFLLLIIAALGSVANKAAAQMKVAVFDIDYMVQAMPGYAAVDSMVQIYQRDSLATEYQFLNSEYKRVDSTLHVDSLSKKSAAILEYENKQKQQFGYQLINWQQYAQTKSNEKLQVFAQPLYEQVVNAYKKVLATRKYAMILKPQTYEAGFPIDNLFISVAKELKMTQLPAELIQLGDDPDATAAATRPAAGAGTATRPIGTAKKP